MKFKPLSNEVLLRHVPEREVNDSIIFYKDDPRDNPVQNFEVLAVGNKCMELEVGNIVMCAWTDMTPPFDFDGQQVTVAPEDRIIAVVE